MTIHRLTVTITVVETMTIRIAQPGDNADEEPDDLAEHPVVDRAGRRGVRWQRNAGTGDGDERPPTAAPAAASACEDYFTLG